MAKRSKQTGANPNKQPKSILKKTADPVVIGSNNIDSSNISNMNNGHMSNDRDRVPKNIIKKYPNIDT